MSTCQSKFVQKLKKLYKTLHTFDDNYHSQVILTKSFINFSFNQKFFNMT